MRRNYKPYARLQSDSRSNLKLLYIYRAFSYKRSNTILIVIFCFKLCQITTFSEDRSTPNLVHLFQSMSQTKSLNLDHEVLVYIHSLANLKRVYKPRKAHKTRNYESGGTVLPAELRLCSALSVSRASLVQAD